MVSTADSELKQFCPHKERRDFPSSELVTQQIKMSPTIHIRLLFVAAEIANESPAEGFGCGRGSSFPLLITFVCSYQR